MQSMALKKKHRYSWPLSHSNNAPPVASHQSTSVHQHIPFVPHPWRSQEPKPYHGIFNHPLPKKPTPTPINQLKYHNPYRTIAKDAASKQTTLALMSNKPSNANFQLSAKIMSDRKPIGDVINYSDQTIEQEIQCRLAIEKKAFIDQEVKCRLAAEKTLNTEVKSYQNDADCSFKAESDLETYEVTSSVKKKKKIYDNETEHNNPKTPKPRMVNGMSYTFHKYLKDGWEQYKCSFWRQKGVKGKCNSYIKVLPQCNDDHILKASTLT
jgi:hypothetical protein